MGEMFTLTRSMELLEISCILIRHYIKLHPHIYIQPYFHSTVVKDVIHLLNITLQTEEDEYDHINAIVEQGMALYYKHGSPPRSSGNTFIRKKPNVKKMRQQINYLQNVPQPIQRTPEWYDFRYNHLTASNIWKIFISDSTRNQLIFEKCKPLDAVKNYGVSLESPMHWGQKYEPLSIKLYEKIYNTKISDFGCVTHKTIEFLAASPDGINTLDTSKRYGRMLEVKNIVNREITGIPKMEYWVQMQLQMEVCELNECDFLETRFNEYENKEAFLADNICEHKGMMMLFMKEGQPIYEYAPLELGSAPLGSATLDLELALEQWQEQMMEKNAEIMWLKNIYWKLDHLSCVLVLRNKLWFAAAIPDLKQIWETIEREKKSGYLHRAPKKNTGIKEKKYLNDNYLIDMQSKCLITIV